MIGSLEFFYYMCLGEFAFINGFSMGKDEDNSINYKWAMYFFFLTGSFLLLVHMMNMLVAKMGDVFARNREVS